MTRGLFGNPSYRCGCFIFIHHQRQYIPLLKTEAHTHILANASRTSLTQTFVNPLKDRPLEELRYEFPLYDGVSVVSFTCTVNDRVIHGRVKERQKARQTYDEAVAKGQTAGLLDQSLDASDVFTMRIGNVPAGAPVKVEIVYLGELKHDAEIDGLRFTLPTFIAPRYGAAEMVASHYGSSVPTAGGISVTVDAQLPLGSSIKTVQSPSHPISVQIGSCSTDSDSDEPSLQKASATLSLGSAEMDKDFILQLSATKLGEPSALLETHPTIPNQRALMTTIVPKFNLPMDKPEIVFICDRSGSMGGGQQIPNLISALNIFLKSLPVGVKFNICSFGSSYEFLWPRSESYSQESLDRAVNYVKTFAANFGGTNMYEPVEETLRRRYDDMNLEVFILTDGEIWDQERLFTLINTQVAATKGATRIFSLGIGHGVSHALIEGIARAGNGFAQTVADNEKMDKKVVRMLKGALTPHITDYRLEIKYAQTQAPDSTTEDEDDFELVEKIESIASSEATAVEQSEKAPTPKPTFSLFDNSIKDNEDPVSPNASGADGKFDHLPAIKTPAYLQSPSQIPPLFPFSRSNVYVLLSESAPNKLPKSVVLRGTSHHGPLELEIPITVLAEKGQMIHQLAARKAVTELEEGRGWISNAKDSRTGQLLKTQHEGRFSEMVEREAVRLGVTYQVGGKWCSFVAVDNEGDDSQAAEAESAPKEAEVGGMAMALRRRQAAPLPPMQAPGGMFGGGPPSGTLVPAASLFGSAAPPPPGAPAPQSRNLGGLFGGGGLFGSAPPPPPAAPAPQSQFGGGLFGGGGSSGGGGGGGLFGSASPPPPGAPAPQSQSNSGASGFSGGGGGLFGSAPSPSPSAPPTSGLFGARPSAQLIPAVFDASTVDEEMVDRGPPVARAGSSTAFGASLLKKVSNPFGMFKPAAPSQSSAFGTISKPPFAFGSTSSSTAFGSAASLPDASAYAPRMSYAAYAPAAYPSPPVQLSAESESLAPNTVSQEGKVTLTGDALQDIAALQGFSGSWDWTPELEKVTGVKRAEVESAASVSNLKLSSDRPDILATVCALVFLRVKLPEEKDAWEMIASKARLWLEGELGSEEDIERWELVLEGILDPID